VTTPETILVYVGSNVDDAIGECLIKLPFLMALRDSFPRARITLVPCHGPSFFDTLLAPLTEGLFDELILDLKIERRPSSLLRPNPLPGRRFDLIIDCQPHWMQTVPLRRIPHRQFISRTWKWFFSSARPPAAQVKGTRLAERLGDLISAAAGQPVALPHCFRMAPHWHDQAAEALPDGPVYVALAPGAGNKARGKCWPLAGYVELARDQLAKGRQPVFLLGPGEAAWRAEIAQTVPQALLPSLDAGPALAVAVARRCAVGVANCSGTGHMMAGAGCAMVSLFAPTNPRKYAPYTPRVICLKAQDFDAEAIDGIPLPAVIEAVDGLVTDAVPIKADAL
jgi:ADP-heptose:LPS heptosyltransferase